MQTSTLKIMLLLISDVVLDERFGDAWFRQGDNRSIAGRGAVHHVKSGKKINGEREFALAA